MTHSGPIPTFEGFLTEKMLESYDLESGLDQIVAELTKLAGGGKAGFDSSLQKIAKEQGALAITKLWKPYQKGTEASAKDKAVKDLASVLSLSAAEVAQVLNNAMSQL